MENKTKKKISVTPSPINMGYKVLVGIPHADVKNYCLDEFLARIKNLSYKNYDVLVVDNSKDKKNHKKILKEGVKSLYVKPRNRVIQSVLAETHETIREYFLKHNYDYLLHLESDIIPPHDVIERLMIHNLPVVSASYMVNFGSESNLMAQEMEWFGELRETANIKDGMDLNMMDGKLHEVFACGLGCVLLKREVLEQVKFRWDGGVIFPDSYFAYDCDAQSIPKFIDTGLLCEHHNDSWSQHFSKF